MTVLIKTNSMRRPEMRKSLSSFTTHFVACRKNYKSLPPCEIQHCDFGRTRTMLRDNLGVICLSSVKREAFSVLHLNSTSHVHVVDRKSLFI